MNFFYEKYFTKDKKVMGDELKKEFSDIDDIYLNKILYYLRDSGYIKIIDADNTGYIIGWILKKGIDFVEEEKQKFKFKDFDWKYWLMFIVAVLGLLSAIL